MLALAALLPGVEGGRDGLGGGDRRHLVGDDDAEHARPLGVPVGLNVGGPGKRLNHWIVHPLMGVGALLPETADGDVDEPRICGAHGVRAQAQAIHGAGAEVLQQHVGGGDQRLHRRQGLRFLQIDAQRALAPVAGEEPWRQTVAARADAPHLITGGGLHLDDLGTLVGQHRRGHRTGDHGGEVHHPHPIEWTGHQDIPIGSVVKHIAILPAA